MSGNATTPEQPNTISSDAINRVWQHGMHEERLFHDRLNYFSFLETGLLTLCGIMYNKEPAVGFFLPLTIVALLFTFLWLIIQTRHWIYCEHVNNRIRQLVPEYLATLEGYARPGRPDGLSLSRPLALAVPALFAGTWVAFLTWILIRADLSSTPPLNLTPERAILLVLSIALGWVILRLRRVEHALDSAVKKPTTRESTTSPAIAREDKVIEISTE